jgi:hypothetical protein
MKGFTIDIENHDIEWAWDLNPLPRIIFGNFDCGSNGIPIHDILVTIHVVRQDDIQLFHVNPTHQAPAIEFLRTTPLVTELQSDIL